MDGYVAGASCVIRREQDVIDRPGTGEPGQDEVLGVVYGCNVCRAETDGIVLDDDAAVTVPERSNCKEDYIEWQVILLHPEPMNLKAWREFCEKTLKQWRLTLALGTAMCVDEGNR
jgi:hypothetical protein